MTNLNKKFVTISYVKSWRELFSIRKSRIRFELCPKGLKQFVLKFNQHEIIVQRDDRICVQVFYYDDFLNVVVNVPINAETIDTDKHVETFAEIFGKNLPQFLCWWNITKCCKSIRTNYL